MLHTTVKLAGAVVPDRALEQARRDVDEALSSL